MLDTTTAQPTIVTCDQCSRISPLKDAMTTREAKYPAIKEIGVLCPHCGHWTHAYFDTPIIAAARQRLSKCRQNVDGSRAALNSFRHEQKRFNRVFDRENRRWRREFGVSVVRAGK